MVSQQDLYKALGIDHLSSDEQEQLIGDLNELIVEGAMTRILEQMDEEATASFKKLLDTNPSEAEIGAFIQRHVQHPEKALQETLEDMKDDIHAMIKAK